MDENYKKYLKSEHWKNLKLQKRKSKYKGCAVCDSKNHLELHHLLYRKRLEDTLTEDLRWFCSRCHETIHELKSSKNYIETTDEPRKIFVRQKNAILKKLGISIMVGGNDRSSHYEHDKVFSRKEMKKKIK